MSKESQPWSELFRPKTIAEIVDNEAAVARLVNWMKLWRTRMPERRAALLYGPPGTGKTSAVQAAANDLGFDLIEINASDYRTAARLEDLLRRGSQQTQTLLGKRRMILFDELEGINGQADRGGVAAIQGLITETRSPIVLVAGGTLETWEDLINPLIRLAELIEFRAIPSAELSEHLASVCLKLGIEAEEEALEQIVEKANGDLRSALNDLESVARGKNRLTFEDVYWLSDRDRVNQLSAVLSKIFSSSTRIEAREAFSSSPVGHEELFEWIYENLPYVYEDEEDLCNAMDALSRADIHKRRADESQEYRLLKYYFDCISGEVALSRKKSRNRGLVNAVAKASLRAGLPASALSIQETREGLVVKPNRYLGGDWQTLNVELRQLGGKWARDRGLWILPYFHPPGKMVHLRASWWSRARMTELAEKLAAKCHVSTRFAASEIAPFIKAIFQVNEKQGKLVSNWLDVGAETVKFLRSL